MQTTDLKFHNSSRSNSNMQTYNELIGISRERMSIILSAGPADQQSGKDLDPRQKDRAYELTEKDFATATRNHWGSVPLSNGFDFILHETSLFRDAAP